jgi:hypothetical protein
MGMKCTKFSVEKSERKRLLRGPRLKRQDNIRIDLKDEKRGR